MASKFDKLKNFAIILILQGTSVRERRTNLAKRLEVMKYYSRYFSSGKNTKL